MAEEQNNKPKKNTRLAKIIPKANVMAGLVTKVPTEIVSLNDQLANGNVTNWMKAAFDTYEKVGEIRHTLKSRASAVTGCPAKFIPADETDEAKTIAEAIEKIWKNIPRKKEFLRDMVFAIYYGVYLGQRIMHDELIDDLWQVKSMDTIPNAALVFRDETGLIDFPRLRTKNFEAFGKDLEPFRDELVYHYVSEQGSPLLGGLGRTLLWYGLFATFDAEAWITFAEVNGMPLRIGRLGPTASDEDRADMEATLENMGRDSYGVLAIDSAIEFIESNKKSSSDVYRDLMKWVTDTIDKLVVGQTKTSDGESGNRALGEVHENTFDVLTTETKQSIEESLQLQLILPLVIINFGGDAAKLMPTLELVFESTKQRAAARKSLIEGRGINIPVSKGYAQKVFGLPITEDADEMLEHTDSGSSASATAELIRNMILTSEEDSWPL